MFYFTSGSQLIINLLEFNIFTIYVHGVLGLHASEFVQMRSSNVKGRKWSRYFVSSSLGHHNPHIQHLSDFALWLPLQSRILGQISKRPQNGPFWTNQMTNAQVGCFLAQNQKVNKSAEALFRNSFKNFRFGSISILRPKNWQKWAKWLIFSLRKIWSLSRWPVTCLQMALGVLVLLQMASSTRKAAPFRWLEANKFYLTMPNVLKLDIWGT